eukprot:GDKI01010728.1.p1 GENE.GDKI01010728.1~~GDKI01010728.1.p1  ORF type:complete len:261 (-),score=34.83 GDKI01010728.1:103-885(-)
MSQTNYQLLNDPNAPTKGSKGDARLSAVAAYSASSRHREQPAAHVIAEGEGLHTEQDGCPAWCPRGLWLFWRFYQANHVFLSIFYGDTSKGYGRGQRTLVFLYSLMLSVVAAAIQNTTLSALFFSLMLNILVGKPLVDFIFSRRWGPSTQCMYGFASTCVCIGIVFCYTLIRAYVSPHMYTQKVTLALSTVLWQLFVIESIRMCVMFFVWRWMCIGCFFFCPPCCCCFCDRDSCIGEKHAKRAQKHTGGETNNDSPLLEP